MVNVNPKNADDLIAQAINYVYQARQELMDASEGVPSTMRDAKLNMAMHALAKALGKIAAAVDMP